MSIENILGWLATALFTVMLIPQIIKTNKVKVINGVSLALFIISLLANTIALAYAILIYQNPLIVKYLLGILFSAMYVVIYYKVKKKGEVNGKSETVG